MGDISIMKRIVLVLVLFLLVGCTEQKATTMSYDEVKKIIVDAIQTEDGKKAVRQILEDAQFRELLVINSDEVKQATEQTLLSEEATDFWKKTFQDPKFKEAIASSMQEQQEKILKDLLHDASYQEDLQTFFSQVEMQKQFETILKSAPLRKQMEEVVMETIENPLLQSKWQELIRQSGEAVSSDKEKSGSEEKKSEGEDQKQKEQ